MLRQYAVGDDRWPTRRLGTVDLSSLRVVFTGGEPLPYAQAAEFEELTGATILQFYGSNETGMLSATTIADPLHRRLRTAGRIVPEMQVRLFDGDATSPNPVADNRLAAGLRSASATWAAPTTTSCSPRTAGCGWATSASWTPTATSAWPGGPRTSSCAAARTSAPSQVEEVVATHPAVAVAAAVAMPDPVFGERVCVFVELKARRRARPAGARRAPARSQGVSKELLPERLEVLDELPRSSGGKVAKGELREHIRSVLERVE